MHKGYLGALTLTLALAGSGEAWGQATNEDLAYGALLVALPVLDGTVYLGGLTAAISGGVQLADGRSSAGWRLANYTFGGLNAASTVSYAIAMGAVRGGWPYLLWPMLAHAGLTTANFVIGYKVGRVKEPRVARLALTPLVSVDSSGSALLGLGAVLTHF